MGETCCLVFTSVVVLAGAIMAVLIGMVLPPYLTTHGYARTVKECDCEPCELPSVECLYKVRLPRLTPRYRAKYKISSYNYLASLSVPLYIDTPHLKVFACNGIIISEQFILTGRGCIDNLDDFDHVTVRCGSEHWNKGGNIHSILFVYQSPINDIYVAKVSPPFTFNGTCGKAVLKPPEESKKNQEDSKEKPPEESKEKPSEESKEKPPEVPKEKTPEGPKEKTPEGSKEKTPEGSKENPPEESKKQPPEVSKKGGNKTKREAIKSTTYYSPGWHKSTMILKTESFTVESFGEAACNRCIETWVTNAAHTCEELANGRPLMDSSQYLIGIHTGSECEKTKHAFADFNDAEMRKWLDWVLINKTHGRPPHCDPLKSAAKKKLFKVLSDEELPVRRKKPLPFVVKIRPQSGPPSSGKTNHNTTAPPANVTSNENETNSSNPTNKTAP